MSLHPHKPVTNMALQMRLPNTPPRGVSLRDKNVIYNYKDERKVWEVGGDIVKMNKYDAKNSEVGNTQFIEKNFPSIPVPFILEEWQSHDREWHYVMMTRVPGVSLSRAWSSLTTDRKARLATEVARHMRTLGRFTSPHMRGVSGKPLINNCFVPGRSGRHLTGTFKTDDDVFDGLFLPEFRRVGLSRSRINLLRLCMPPCEGQYALYHGDLYTGNIMVDRRSGSLTAVIDWESFGYWPKWFHYARLSWEVNTEDGEWKQILAAIMKPDIPHAMHGEVWWNAVMVLLAENPKSRRARDWLDLLHDYLQGYPLVVPLEQYQSYRSKDYSR